MATSCIGRIQAITLAALASLGWGGGYAPGPAPGPAPAGPAGKAAAPSPFTDYTSERPGKRIKITPADLPPPRATRSADNPPRVVKRPKDAWPQAPAGFKVELYADGLADPRLIRVAPNGDAFVVESGDGVVRLSIRGGKIALDRLRQPGFGSASEIS